MIIKKPKISALGRSMLNNGDFGLGIMTTNNVKVTNVLLSITRFSERIFINHSQTRKLLRLFCKKGLSHDELGGLDTLISSHIPCMKSLIDYIKCQCDLSLPLIQCPLEWSNFISVLASDSPVCAFVHPSEDLFLLLRRTVTCDVTREAESMERLQKEVPVLFELFRALKSVPIKFLSPVIDNIIMKAKAPFVFSDDEPHEKPNSSDIMDLAWFPHLPCVRERRVYEADRNNKSKGGCNKLSAGHPTLLPGIFTSFCQRGQLVV